ncbi:cupin domain-containing protein [Xanthobacter sp. DSM 24535]|jgi:quercetin dioxygenase-like cupin family protein|uniref:(R)-mandelonitrile lyase n=1 Tax=Roseixanthobacter psychrophilus TaxID=3119917 RepID=UPI0037262662
MEIKRGGSTPSRKAPAKSFTGTVWQDPIIEAPEPALLKSNVVMFEPGARTAWHTHPMGQTLYVTAGIGLCQSWGGPIQEFRAGDVIWIAPGEKHWHGATPTNMMTHISMQEGHNGVVVEWLEHVTDEQYNGAA